MKKRIPTLLFIVLATILLATTFMTACASAGDNAAPAETMAFRATGGSGDVTVSAPQAEPMPVSDSFYDDMEDSAVWNDSIEHPASEQDGGGIIPISAPAPESLAEKIIYSVFAYIETLNFDETIENVHMLIAAYNAFIEHSNISGTNYAARFNNWSDYRDASFTIRVPVENLNAMTSRFNILGLVVTENSNATNITMQFHDTQSRLNSLRIQEERLLDMLSKATDVPDLITIEERLGDVRYQVEWLTTMLNNWQRQVDYSTVTINIREVEKLTEQVPIHRTYWQQIGDGFMSTMRGIGRFFMGLFMWLIVSAPVLLILAVIGVVIFLIIRRKLRSIKKNAIEKPNSTAPNFNEHVYKPPENND